MEEEIKASTDNGTWSHVEQTTDMNVIGVKWVFKVTYTTDGKVERLKARLVNKGYNQQEGVDYYENISPIIKLAIGRLILIVAIVKGWRIHQMDVKSAFLNSNLQEMVYVSQPTGFIYATHPNHVCKLKKVLCGLKQDPRACLIGFVFI